MSEYVTLEQLMDYIVNMTHVIIVLGYWIFDSNYQKTFALNRESLDIICAPSIGDEKVSKFETVFYAVRYICSTSQLNKEYYI